MEGVGFRLITPLRLTGSDQAVLVDRGWIEADADPDELLLRYRRPQAATLEGIVLGPQSEPNLAFLADDVPQPGAEPLRAWRVLNIGGVQGQLPYALLPIYIAQTEPLEGAGARPEPQPEINTSEGPHLSDAIQ